MEYGLEYGLVSITRSCSGDLSRLQHVSASFTTAQRFRSDFNPKVAGSIPARPTSPIEVRRGYAAP